jgi:hypothetical protein
MMLTMGGMYCQGETVNTPFFHTKQISMILEKAPAISMYPKKEWI